MSKRRTHSPDFKAMVAIEAISGPMTIQDIAADGAARMIQVGQCMGQLLDGASEFPRMRRGPTPLRQRCNGLGWRVCRMGVPVARAGTLSSMGGRKKSIDHYRQPPVSLRLGSAFD